MEEELQEALDSCEKATLQAVFRKVYLVGQDGNDVLRKVFEGACKTHDTDTIERIFDLDYASLPSLRPIHANGIWPQAVEESLEEDCTCTLRCFLRNGLDPHQSLGEQGDVLMWAVRCRDAYTVMHLLRSGSNPQGVKVCYYVYFRGLIW
jgi:hypothetical protein